MCSGTSGTSVFGEIGAVGDEIYPTFTRQQGFYGSGGSFAGGVSKTDSADMQACSLQRSSWQ